MCGVISVEQPHFLVRTLRLDTMVWYSPTGNTLSGELFFSIVPPRTLDQFDGDRKQLHHVGHAGFYTVAHQPCTTLGIRMDILVRDLLQIRVRQTCEAHEQEHVTDSPLALVIQLDMDDALQVLLGEEMNAACIRAGSRNR